jgi:hypothetical protein
MYRTCLHCHAPLGTNEVVEHFRVGRRLAFDSAKGRLWVVCDKCRRWNLTPVEERWEAIEECEREFSRTRLRASTDNIAVARVPAGLDLVRVGRPKFPELAAWRYGKALHQRWKTRALPAGALGMGGFGAQLLLNANILGFLGAMGVVAAAIAPLMLIEWRRNRVRVALPDGTHTTINYHLAKKLELEPDAENGWALQLSAGGSVTRFTGMNATHTMRGLLTGMNFFGGRRADVDGAISLLNRTGDATRFIARVAAAGRATGLESMRHLPPDVRLGLEMALHEQSERRALEGELADLRDEWQLAEEIAGIADNLLIPSRAIEQFDRLKSPGSR